MARDSSRKMVQINLKYTSLVFMEISFGAKGYRQSQWIPSTKIEAAYSQFSRAKSFLFLAWQLIYGR